MHLIDVCTLLDLNPKTIIDDENVMMSATDDVVMLFDEQGESDE